jgi:methionyl-tRNA formyltransferase
MEGLESYLHSQADSVVFFQERMPLRSRLLKDKDFLVSFGYRYILSKDVLEKFHGRAINVHISLLPWNRGADPNLWSFLEDTPKGVSIHYLTDKLDCGDIICQQEVKFSLDETLKSTYQQLIETAQKLFIRHWPEIKTCGTSGLKQSGPGSYHRKRDADPYRYLLGSGWDTPVRELIGRALNKKVAA